VLYALALERGATLADVIVDAPLAESVGDGLHRYRNYSERHYGPVTLRDALGNSLNIPALKLLHDIGPATYLEHLERLGITSLGAHPDVYGDGLALGNGELTLFELVQAYQAHANAGQLVPLTVLTEPTRSAHRETVVSAETASLLADALSDPDARSAEFGRDSVLNLTVQTAVKTGTSSDYRDAWTVGFDARFTVGIWMGNLDQTPTGGITGSTGPALLLRSVFANLNRDGTTRPLYLSPKLTRERVCVPSPLSPDQDCVMREEWFDPGHAIPDRTDSPQPAAAAVTPASPRLRRPTDGLELAWDPRLPAESQAFEFQLDGVVPDDQVRWTIDGDTRIAAGASFVWPVTRGTHRVSAAVVRSGVTAGPVEFFVR
jgi:penicillin-binding protein 1C